MRRSKITLIVCVLVAIGLPIGELAIEEVSYLLYAWSLVRAQSRINEQMTKEDVLKLAGEPDRRWMIETGEVWDWSAAEHQGRLWAVIGLTSVKGHRDLNVAFDSNNRVIKVLGDQIDEDGKKRPELNGNQIPSQYLKKFICYVDELLIANNAVRSVPAQQMP